MYFTYIVGRRKHCSCVYYYCTRYMLLHDYRVAVRRHWNIVVCQYSQALILFTDMCIK